jgi:hypothetical protein
MAAARASLGSRPPTATDELPSNESTARGQDRRCGCEQHHLLAHAQEVLSIAYGGGKGGGAFFPNGLNGRIK